MIGFSGKCDKPPEQWFASSRFASKSAQEAYLNLHLIPKDPELWKLESFDKFIEARKELITSRFSGMLPGDLRAEKVADVVVQKAGEQSNAGAHEVDAELIIPTTVIANNNSEMLPRLY